MSEKNTFPTLKRLSQVLATYGGNPEKWPARERPGLINLLKRSSAEDKNLQRQFDQARFIDELLEQAAATEDVDVTADVGFTFFTIELFVDLRYVSR